MGAPLGLARTQGQKRPGAVQGLDLGLLVHAQDQRPVRRVEVEPHNIPHLLDEEGVRRQLEGLGAVGLQREGTPDAAHGVAAQTGTPSHGPGAPVCSILRCGLQGQRHDSQNVSIGDSAGSARPCLIHQSVQPALQEPRPPLANRRLRHSQLCGHSGVRLALRTFQNHSGPLGQRLRRLGSARPLSQCLPFIVGFSSFLLCPLRMTRWPLFLQTLSLLLHHFLRLYCSPRPTAMHTPQPSPRSTASG